MRTDFSKNRGARKRWCQAGKEEPSRRTPRLDDWSAGSWLATPPIRSHGVSMRHVCSLPQALVFQATYIQRSKFSVHINRLARRPGLFLNQIEEPASGWLSGHNGQRSWDPVLRRSSGLPAIEWNEPLNILDWRPGPDYSALTSPRVYCRRSCWKPNAQPAQLWLCLPRFSRFPSA